MRVYTKPLSLSVTIAAMTNFVWTLRVYWEDTDAGGVVFYANYLKFFERARTEWLRALGIEQQSLADEAGVVFNAPARLDDQLEIRTRIDRVGPASVQFTQEAWRGELMLASGAIRVGCVDRSTFRPAPIPDPVLATIKSAR